ERETEGLGGVRTALLSGLADHARQDDLDLLHLAGRGELQVLARAADGAHRGEMVQGVDRLGARRLEEELRDVGTALIERANAVGEVAAVGVSLAGQRDEEIRFRLRAGAL